MDLHDETMIRNGRLYVRHNGRWLPVPSGAADGDTPADPPAGDPPAETATPPAGDPPATTPPDPNQGPDGEPNPAPVHPEAPALPDDITGAPEDSLRALHGELDTYRASARERADAAGVTTALDRMDAIAAEINRRRDEAAENARRLADADARQVPSLPEPAVAGAGVSAAQLASVRDGIDGTTPAGSPPPAPALPARPAAALLAAAGVERGQEVDLSWIGQQLERAKQAPVGTAVLASVPAFDSADPGVPDLLLASNSIVRNDELIAEAVEDWRAIARNGEDPARMAAARTAAICGPFDIIRDIPDAFVSSTPVADLFPSRPAGRGGWQFTPSGVLSDVTGSVSLWNEANQAAVDVTNSATWKPCKVFTCPTAQSANVEAIVQCVTYDNTLEMSLPERVRNLNNAVEALAARTYEGRLLQRIDALSHPFRFTGDYGALPALVEALNSLIPQLTYWNRQEDGQYDAILPLGVLNVLGIDRANRAYGQEQQAGDVLSYIRDNVPGLARIVVALDPSLGGEPGTFSDPLPSVGVEAQRGAIPYISGAVYRIRLVDPAAAIYATTGEVNAGVLRDANMVRQNRTGYFTERFFMLEKHGPQPWANIDVKLCADGSRAGLVAPNGCLVS